jgi:hypothetical protein
MGWLWNGPVRGGDGARGDTPPKVSLFHNSNAEDRHARQRARDNGRKASTMKAMKARRIKRIRETGKVKPPAQWW